MIKNAYMMDTPLTQRINLLPISPRMYDEPYKLCHMWHREWCAVHHRAIQGVPAITEGEVREGTFRPSTANHSSLSPLDLHPQQSRPTQSHDRPENYGRSITWGTIIAISDGDGNDIGDGNGYTDGDGDDIGDGNGCTDGDGDDIGDGDGSGR